jgi:hypothetical protein
MTYGGHGSGQADPFGPDPLGGAPSTPGYPPPITYASTGPGFPPPSFPPAGTPQGEVNTLATLSIVFAFVFPPAGAVLGHVALAQIRQRGERGRERALIGLTLSYVIIVLALIALVVWFVTSSGSESSPSVTTSTTAASATTMPALPPPRTTVITPPPQQRPTVQVEDLRVGDCVEVQQNQPDPTRGPSTNIINIFPVRCEVRDGVFRVDQISSTNSCPGQTLFNTRETVFACISNYRG